PATGNALIDTGATITAVDNSIVQQLGIKPTGVRSVGTAGGTSQQPVYPILIKLPAHNIAMQVGSATGATLGQLGIIALLGRDFLQNTLLIYDGPRGIILLAN